MARPRSLYSSLILIAVILRPAHAGEPPTAKIMVNPVPAKVGPPYPPLADGGPNIVGNELRLDAGGVRVWVEVQFEDWDPNGDGSPAVGSFLVTLDGSGLLDADIDADGDVTDDGDQEDIVHPVIPCSSHSDCYLAFGEVAENACVAGRCRAVYGDKGTRPDGWCYDNCCGVTTTITESGWSVYMCTLGPRPGDGTLRWGATAVYDVPIGAKGKYTVNLDTDATFFSTFAVPPEPIPSLSESGFVIHVLTGQCCFGLGTSARGCVDAVTRAECGDDEPGPVAFAPEEQCPPEGPNCGGDFGACCSTLQSTCEAPVAELDCQDSHSFWNAGLSCAQVECTADTGACCSHDPFDPCTQTALSNCQCPTCTWDKLRSCDEIECPATSIPTVSAWGLAVLTLLLMIGAKIVFGQVSSSA